MKRVHVFVRGRVQGVGYRYFVMREAGTLGVSGFARNLPDGSVEVVAEAADEVLEAFEGRLREGPSFAQVTEMTFTSEKPSLSRSSTAR